MGEDDENDQNDRGTMSSPEPPAGLDFSSIRLLDLLNTGVRTAGYELISSPPCYHDLQPRHRRHSLRRSCTYKTGIYSATFDEKHLRATANTADGETVERLIESCPHINIDAADEKGRTALHFASTRGADDVVHVLLRSGADANVKDANGNSPLHLAACTHHIRVITLLLHYGGDVQAMDLAGKTPLHLALSRLRMLEKREPYIGQPFYSVYLSSKRKAEVGEIVSMLSEYFIKFGKENEAAKMSEINERLNASSTDSEVDQIGSMLADFTQMTIDAGARSRMSEE